MIFFLTLLFIIIYMLFLFKAISKIINKSNLDNHQIDTIIWLFIVLFAPLIGLILYYNSDRAIK